MSNCSRKADGRGANRPEGPGPRRNAFRRIGILAALFLSGLAAAGPFADLNARQSKLSDKQVVAELKGLETNDPEIDVRLRSDAKAARAYIDLRATLEGGDAKAPPKIGAAPGGERLASSWLDRALKRIKGPDIDLPEAHAAPIGIGAWATTLMWILLGGLLGLAIYLLVRYVKLPTSRRRSAMVDAEEPVRSSDEWLDEANTLIARGEYRAAVRGLYVAGLMRFDEAGVARFDRHQTNWEHLRRIESSPKTPPDADVRGATVRFDRLWYGLIPATEADARAMRAWYDDLVRRLAEVRAAEPRAQGPNVKGPNVQGPGAMEAQP